MEFLQEYGLFLAKVVTFVVALVVVIGILVVAGQARRSSKQGYIEARKYNDDVEDMVDTIHDLVMDKFQLKLWRKAQEKKDKQEQKAAKKQAKTARKSQSSAQPEALPELEKQHYVVDFDGDIKASEVDKMRNEITAILAVAKSGDEVIVRLESAGGMVHSYGLAASQLARIRDAGLPLTICVDKVAASGGYMMACLADKIIAAPFAVVGSIGVVAEVPNIHRLLKKHDIDVEVMTAGEHKRTVTLMGENTRKGKDKFMQDLQITHDLFKQWVAEQRPQVNIKEVANGDVWYGQQALSHELVDALGTSDDYLQQLVRAGASVVLISYQEKKSVGEKLGMSAAGALEALTTRIWSNSHKNQLKQ